jgi:hypothetical protein
MSVSQYLRQLEAKRRQRVDADKKASDFRTKEAEKRAAASKAAAAASRSSSASMVAGYVRTAARHESEANDAGKQAAYWQTRAAGYAKDEVSFQAKLAKAEQQERDDAERRRKRDQQADAITYAAQFYAAVANGQSIQSAHMLGRAALELAGLAGQEMPTLAHANDVDPSQAILVVPPK